MKKVIIRQRKYETRAAAERRVVMAAFANWTRDPSLQGVKAVIAVMTDGDERKLAERNLKSWFENRRDEKRAACIEGRNEAFDREIDREVDFMAKHPGFVTNSPF